MKSWCFTEHDKRLPVWWTWRVDGDDGGIAQVSAGFPTCGEAVADAVRNGYRPCDDDCVLETTHAVMHFGRGKHAVSAIESGARGPSKRKRIRKRIARRRLPGRGKSSASERQRPVHDGKRVAAEQ